ncbi:Glutamine synthetase [Streptomyces sp. YIM 130001]|uniref:glutamine synthetase family protein n=1 Tax=Streptomyces sp. YIM 130001 TaxID=2259644 RepID=UPI000E6595D8|nr:glutamine synthetase family protein [Streptomyces sp. YIM 130001]RII07918.1 Glutamine synthetase [Streptomyces sp. YIM 130001]
MAPAAPTAFPPAWTGRQVSAAEELDARLEETDLVRLAFCDPHGLVRSKTLSRHAFGQALRQGMTFSPGPFTMDSGHAPAICDLSELGLADAAAGNILVMPDPLSFRWIPGSSPRTALCLGDEVFADGAPYPLSARALLRRVCAQYADRGLVPLVGVEIEWYLTRLLGGSPGNEGNGFGTQGPAPAVEAVNSGYQFNLDSCYESVAPVTDALALQLLELGLPLRTMEHESGPGQIETTLAPLHALDAADAVLVLRNHAKRLCARRGFHASFMSLPRLEGFDPSGWHIHQSVLEESTGRSVFASEDRADVLSEAGRSYADGLLARARETCLLSVPTINGYRRFGPDFPLAPAITDQSFGGRGALLRTVGTGDAVRVEHRMAEPCANPYLAIASQLAAGLEGMSEPGRGGRGGPEQLPGDLAESLAAFRAGRAAELLGKPLAECLIRLKESELARYRAWQELPCPSGNPYPGGVTVWEQQEYFAVF